MEELSVFLVEQAEAGERIDRFLTRRTGLSRNQVRRQIDAGAVSVDGEVERKKSRKLKRGERVAWIDPQVEACDLSPEAIDLDILHEDADLLVVNKPAGMVVHPAAGNPGGTLVNALLAHCRNLTGIGGVLRPGIVHRIDKDTSGLLVVAKNDEAHRALTRQFAERSVERSYQAFVFGVLPDSEAAVRADIGRHPTDRKRFAVLPDRGKAAVTHYKVLAIYGEISHLELRLETGRTHQIRVHMAHIGHPVIGDSIYCHPRRVTHVKDKRLKDRLSRVSRQALHTGTLGFIHPRSGRFLRFSSPLPDDMASLLDWLYERYS